MLWRDDYHQNVLMFAEYVAIIAVMSLNSDTTLLSLILEKLNLDFFDLFKLKLKLHVFGVKASLY